MFNAIAAEVEFVQGKNGFGEVVLHGKQGLKFPFRRLPGWHQIGDLEVMRFLVPRGDKIIFILLTDSDADFPAAAEQFHGDDILQDLLNGGFVVSKEHLTKTMVGNVDFALHRQKCLSLDVKTRHRQQQAGLFAVFHIVVEGLRADLTMLAFQIFHNGLRGKEMSCFTDDEGNELLKQRGIPDPMPRDDVLWNN